MLSKLFRLNAEDLYRGLYIAVATVVLGAFQQMVSAHGIDFGSYEWATILDVAWKAGTAYLIKNFLSDDTGTPIGMAKIKALGASIGLPTGDK